MVEAVFEDIGIKQKVFADLDRVAKAGAVLASNTSYLDLDTLARSVERPQAVVGTLSCAGECHAPRRSGARRRDLA